MSTAVLWFRGLLRLHDNPALNYASLVEEVESVLPVYVLGKEDESLGVNRLRFLYESLANLDNNLRERYGHGIIILSGDPKTTLCSLFGALGHRPSYLLTDYRSEPSCRTDMQEIVDAIGGSSTRIKVFPAVSTILDVEDVILSDSYTNPKSSKDIENILVRHLDMGPDGLLVGESLPVPEEIRIDGDMMKQLLSNRISNLQIIPLEQIMQRLSDIGGVGYFPGGESEALNRLRVKVSDREDFVRSFSKPDTVSTNEDGNPMEPTTTGLSPYLSTGCLSVRMAWNEVTKANLGSGNTKPPVSLHGQLMFREMFYLLSRSVENWDDDKGNSNCKEIGWDDFDQESVDAWSAGMTGFPYIDAMMRQLDETGWMHHLGRHAVSCFLTRGQLWQNWKHGRDVFESKLIDSDWAVNNGNWLWLAGVAPFSMPYYRVYNPCPDPKSSLNVEAKKADFVRHWVPELSSFPSKYIFEPHLAPSEVQHAAKCVIGVDYPFPIVDRKEARKENLAAFKMSLDRS